MSGWSEQAALTARNRALAETGGGKEKGLALVNEVGIAEIGVGGGDAGPGCGMAELRFARWSTAFRRGGPGTSLERAAEREKPARGSASRPRAGWD